MKLKKDRNNDPAEKLEKAKSIAKETKKRDLKSVNDFGSSFLSVFGGLTRFLQWIFQSDTISSIFALVMAIILYITVNASGVTNNDITQSATLNNIPVSVVYNSEIYEISGIPSSVNVIVQGDMSDITLQKSQTNSNVVVDLSGLTEGTHSIKMEPNNFNSKLVVNVLDTPTVTVSIKKKVTTKFSISYEYINKNAMDATYALSNPTFDTTEVLIRASQDTIDSIAFVKALIDVTGAKADFTTEAQVLAYDNNGHIVDCDIIPEKVNVSVEVTSPSKEVPIRVRPIGTLIEGISIDSISLDYSSVKLYAAQNILNMIDEIVVDVDVTNLTKDTIWSTTLTTPADVNSMSLTRVNMTITLGETVTKEIKDVKVSWINYDAKYKFMIVNAEDALMSVTVSGTANNIDKLTSNDVSVSIDLANVTIGTQQVPLIVTGNNPYVTYSITSGKHHVEVAITE